MRTHAFGHLGPVPVIGQGTWNMEQDDRTSCIAAIRAGLDLGATHVDTAELYGHGDVEALLGEALEGRREEVFLVSKVLPSNASRRGTIEACERSLRALRTDRLDAYLLHWPGSFPLEETIAAFEELVQVGKIGGWGVSNFDVPELEEALRIAGPGRIACNQVLYHLGERAIEHAVLPFCEAHGIAVVGYSPFGSGRSPHHAVLDEIAKRHGVSARAVTLAFLVRRPSLFAIPKAAKSHHVQDNARAASLALSSAELAAIEKAFPLGRKPRTLPTA